MTSTPPGPTALSLERVTYPEYLAEWEVFATLSKVPQRRRDRSLVDRKEKVAAPRDSKVLPRWRFFTPLDRNEYYYQVLLLNVPFRSGGERSECLRDFQGGVLFEKPGQAGGRACRP